MLSSQAADYHAGGGTRSVSGMVRAPASRVPPPTHRAARAHSGVVREARADPRGHPLLPYDQPLTPQALVLSHDITEAARVLGDAASLAHLSPRLTGELHTARALMQPWAGTQAVTTLDAQLHACGLMPTMPGPTVT